MTGKYILTHDLGTSGNKAVLFDLKLNALYQTKVNYPIYYPKQGWVEQEPEDFWNAVIKATHTLIHENNINPEDIIGLIFDSQGNCTIPIDQQGSPLMRAISWLDTRASSITHKYSEGEDLVSGYNYETLNIFLNNTGGAPGLNGKDPVSHIIWLKENDSEIYDKTYKFFNVKDFVVYKCTNNAITSVDLGNTSWMMDSDLNKLNWSDVILDKFEIDKQKLPEVKKSTDVAGNLTKEAAEELGLISGLPVFVGSIDLTSGALGSGAINEKELIVCLGTADFVAAHISEQKKNIAYYTGSICSAQNNYLCISKQETGAACLDWIANQMFKGELEKYKNNPKELYEFLNSTVEGTEAGAKNIIFTPWMYGERAPINDSNVRGGFYNLSLAHKRADLLRAVYEGVAFNIKWGLTYVERLVGKSKQINAIGGGCKSDIWCQILADILEKNINKVAEPDLACNRGLAIIAMVGSGILQDFSEAIPLIQIEKSFTPNPEPKKIYKKIFREFTKIYERNTKMFENLNA
ncbi:MAG: FGGY-family carbohydrate kinase [Candidatus Neomarinimicrobiota bacterium]